MSRIYYLTVPAVLAVVPAYAATYHTVESAQQACFPGADLFVSADVTVTKDQKKTVEKKSGSRMRGKVQKIWEVSTNGEATGWFIIDEVIGKHEYITYATALNPDGSVKSVEILEYREHYGSEIQRADWRLQFAGKTKMAPLELTEDIKNISGATLSCRHITEGVKRILVLHDLLLKHN